MNKQIGQVRQGKYRTGKDHPKYKRSYSYKGVTYHSADALGKVLGVSKNTVIRRANIGMYQP